jgi:hypothetical protein
MIEVYKSFAVWNLLSVYSARNFQLSFLEVTSKKKKNKQNKQKNEKKKYECGKVVALSFTVFAEKISH